MLITIEKGRKYLFWIVVMGLFGIGGLLLIPVVMYIIKVSNRHPKAFRWVCCICFAFTGIYGFLFEREWNTGFIIICIAAVIAVGSTLNTNDK